MRPRRRTNGFHRIQLTIDRLNGRLQCPLILTDHRLGRLPHADSLVALFKDDYYVVGSSGLVLDVSYTAWGWIHIVGGAIVVAAGVALFAGKMWARVLGVAMACVSAIVNIGFLAAYPVWSAMVIFMDIAIIMALTVHGSAMEDV